ncbi:MAG: putative selenium-dependent hydroxylase accessory protein YqeC [Chloroflexi bacterium]|nr:putative selenium-dependent hydroxylase accessory protein YqeC [Chloroflexota bacterium]
MKFTDAFGIEKGAVVSLIGAGGKTSLLVGIGYELAEAGWRVLAAATVPVPEEQLSLFPAALHAETDPATVSRTLSEVRFVVLHGGIVRKRALAVDPGLLDALLDRIDSDVMLVEADTAAGLPLKAPHNGEPQLPKATTLVIPVASFAAVGQALNDENVYNAQAMIDRCGFPLNGSIRPSWIAQVIRDEQLGMSGVPRGVRTIAFFNQTPMTPYNRVRARIAAKIALRHSTLHAVALGEVRGHEPVREVQRPVGAVVLAAGMSTRMGQPKQLLPWRDNRTIIEHIVEQLIKARVDPIVVVTGHNAKEVKAVLAPWDVTVVNNRAYKTGEMLSSLKTGLAAMPAHTAAALMVLGDQPALQTRVVNRIVLTHAEAQHELIVPSYDMRRGHPVLIGRRYWNEIISLGPSTTPRVFFDRFADHIHYVEIDNDSILRDIDTPQDYDRDRGIDRGERRR